MNKGIAVDEYDICFVVNLTWIVQWYDFFMAQ